MKQDKKFITAREKAKELVDGFKFDEFDSDLVVPKEFANTLVDEITKTLDELFSMQDKVSHVVGLKHWWLEVKEEIKNYETR